MQAQSEYDFESEEEETADVTQPDVTDKEAFMANIPQTDEAKKASNEKIALAMFNIGEAYRDDLNEPAKAAAEFENLIRRFPDNSLLVDSYVALYEIYTKTGDADKAGYYKNLMSQHYPNSPKVLAATDPGYVNRLKTQEASEETDYYTALNYYTSNRLRDAYTTSANGLTKYPSGRLAPQFSLLKVLSDNYNGDIVKYRAALEDVVKKYPGNTAASYAQDLLKNLEKSEFKLITESKTANAQDTGQKEKSEPSNESVSEQKIANEILPKYFIQFNQQAANSIKSRYSIEDGPHAFVVITDANMNMNRLRFNILFFNTTNHIDENYEVKIVDFANNKMVIMPKIKDRNTAVEFFNEISSDKKVFNNMTVNDYVSFIILESNLELMRSGTSFLDYVDFFNKVYTY
jgi:TolA-binding protein